MHCSLLPRIMVLFLHMLAVVGPQLQVFYSIISLVAIYVMDSLVFGKRASKVLFHYVAMLKNPFAINIDANIAERGNRWLPLFEIGPIGGRFSVASHARGADPGFLFYACRHNREGGLRGHYPARFLLRWE